MLSYNFNGVLTLYKGALSFNECEYPSNTCAQKMTDGVAETSLLS